MPAATIAGGRTTAEDAAGIRCPQKGKGSIREDGGGQEKDAPGRGDPACRGVPLLLVCAKNFLPGYYEAKHCWRSFDGRVPSTASRCIDNSGDTKLCYNYFPWHEQRLPINFPQRVRFSSQLRGG